MCTFSQESGLWNDLRTSAAQAIINVKDLNFLDTKIRMLYNLDKSSFTL